MTTTTPARERLLDVLAAHREVTKLRQERGKLPFDVHYGCSCWQLDLTGKRGDFQACREAWQEHVADAILEAVGK